MHTLIHPCPHQQWIPTTQLGAEQLFTLPAFYPLLPLDLRIVCALVPTWQQDTLQARAALSEGWQYKGRIGNMIH